MTYRSIKSKTGCGKCNSTGCNDCCKEQDCGCKVVMSDECVRHTGADLECLGIIEGDSLATMLSKINKYICELDIKTDDVSYCGEDIECDDEVVISSNMTLTEIITSLSDRICSIPAGATGATGAQGIQGIQGVPGQDGADGADGADGECLCETVLATIERAPVITETQATVTSTSYTVPVAGDGNYRILYVGHADFISTAGTATLYVMKNGVEVSADVRRIITVGSTGFMLPFSVFATNIPLVAGDTLSISGMVSAVGIAIRNCVLEISKI